MLHQIFSIVSIILIIVLFTYVLGSAYQLIRLRKKLFTNQSALMVAAQNERDLSAEIAELKAKTAQQALKDLATDLPIWEIFKDDLERAVENGQRFHYIVGVLCLDVDDFHVVNNALGHKLSNRVLKEVSLRILSSIRKIDAVTRYGKDTFFILLAQLARPEVAAVVVQRLFHAFAEPIRIDGQEFNITMGIGIAIYPVDGTDSDTLIHKAEQALYEAKIQGKNSYLFYHAEIQQRGQREFILRASASQENFYQQLEIFYQPILDAKQGMVICMDANIRWHHAELGLIESAELFEIAKACGKNHGPWTMANATGLQTIAKLAVAWV